MADIHIQREHTLGLLAARKIAFKWTEQLESEFDVVCTYEKGGTTDTMAFARPGVSGTLLVTKDQFNLNAKLGLLLGAFKGRIEAAIVKNIDQLLEEKPVKRRSPKPNKPEKLISF